MGGKPCHETTSNCSSEFLIHSREMIGGDMTCHLIHRENCVFNEPFALVLITSILEYNGSENTQEDMRGQTTSHRDRSGR